MKANYSHITFILDRSGSMSSIRNDVIGGFNRFLAEQQAVPGECTLTLVQFDTQDQYEILRDFEPIANVKPLGSDYQPRAGTPLYDALGRGIVNTGIKLSSLTEDQRPEKVIFAILTDGEENSSHEYTRDKVFAMTKEQREKWKWEFVYLGANQDAMQVCRDIAIPTSGALNYASTPTGTAAVMRTASSNVANYRTGATPDCAFTDEQKKEVESA